MFAKINFRKIAAVLLGLALMLSGTEQGFAIACMTPVIEVLPMEVVCAGICAPLLVDPIAYAACL